MKSTMFGANGEFVWLYLLNPFLYSMELVPSDRAKIEVYINVFKNGDIPITIGAVSP